MFALEMIDVALAFCTAYAIAWCAVPSIIILARRFHLFDEPDARKLHTRNVPTLGGIALFAGFIIAFTFWSAAYSTNTYSYIQAAALVLFFFGVKDDLAPLTPFKKLFGQLLAAGLIVLGADIRIQSFYGVLSIGELPYWLSAVFSIFTIVVIINAVNLIDGVDGLAAGLCFISSVAFGCLFYVHNQAAYAVLAFAMSGALLAFFRFNKAPAQIFMGDSGSLLMGLLLAVLAIALINISDTVAAADSLADTVNPALAVSILLIPLFDTLRVFAIRIAKGKSPFRPDKNHIHHRLIDLGLGHWATCAVLCTAHLAIILLSLYLNNLSTPLLVFLQLFAAAILSQVPAFIKYTNENKPIL